MIKMSNNEIYCIAIKYADDSTPDYNLVEGDAFVLNTIGYGSPEVMLPQSHRVEADQVFLFRKRSQAVRFNKKVRDLDSMVETSFIQFSKEK